MPTHQRKRKALSEDIAYQPQARPDRDLAKVKALLDQGIVENVKIQGWESRNSRRYLPEGVEPSLYDKKPVNLNHPRVDNPRDQLEMRRAVGGSRDVTGVFGETRDPRKEADGIYGAIWFHTAHPYAETFRKFVLDAPHLIGLSPAQFGDTYEHDGGEIVERVDDVRSVDLVGSSATTKGLLEGDQADDKDEPPTEEGEDAALDDALAGDDLEQDLGDSTEAPAEGETPASEPDASESTGIDITPEMFQSVTKIVQAFFDKQIDEAGAMSKIKQIFRTHAAIAESIMPKLETPKTTQEAAKVLGLLATRIKSQPAKTAIEKVLLENRQYRAKDQIDAKAAKARVLMDAASLPKEIAEDKAFLEELLDCRSDQRMQTKIELWRKLFGTRTHTLPRSAGQVALTEEERIDAERSFGMQQPKAISDEDRNKRIDAFSKRYAGTSYATFLTSGLYINETSGLTVTNYNHITTIESLFGHMTDLATGDPIDVNINNRKVLCTFDKYWDLRGAFTATDVLRGAFPTSGDSIQQHFPTPLGMTYEIVASKLLYNMLTTHAPGGANMSAADAKQHCWWGDFMAAFGYREVYPITIIQAPPQNPAEFYQDIAIQSKVSEYGVPFVQRPQQVTHSYQV